MNSYLFIFIIVFFQSYIYPQLIKEKVISLISNDEISNEVCDVSRNGTLIIKESQNNDSNSNFYLYFSDIKNKKIFLANSSNNRKEAAWFCKDYVVISLLSNNKMHLKIIDTKNGTEKNINSDLGDIVSASILDFNNILYQVRIKNEVPQIFYIKNNEKTFFSNGIGEQWSPNGKWILVRDINKIKHKKNRNTNEESNSFYKIYNLNGTEVITLTKFENCTDVTWSPNSDKIVLREIGDRGFYILYIESFDNGLVIKDTYHFKGFDKIDSNNSWAINLEWDLNGENIIFTKTVENGEKILETSTWAHNVNNHTNKLITDSSPNNVTHIGFNSNGNILLVEKDKEKETNIIQIYLK